MQVSLSFVLLVGAGLLLQSLQRIRNSSPGFSTHEVLDTTVNLVQAGYDPQRAQNFQDELLDRVKALPGVESAAFARMTPLSYGSFSSTPIAVDGYQSPPDEQPIVQYNEVGPDYFVTMGIPLVSGREFNRADDEKSVLVAIVNETMAAKYWRRQESDWRAGSGQGTMDAGGRGGEGFQVPERSGDAETIFLRTSAPEFRERTGLEHPDAAESRGNDGGADPRGACD